MSVYKNIFVSDEFEGLEAGTQVQGIDGSVRVFGESAFSSLEQAVAAVNSKAVIARVASGKYDYFVADGEGNYSAADQVVYVNFNGGSGLSYDNGEYSRSVDMAPAAYSEAQQADVVAALNDLNAESGVVFTSVAPQGTEFSTVHVGSTSSFDDLGSFKGLSETVDAGNAIPNDEAFVNTNNIADIADLIDTVDHEAGHLIGEAHEGTTDTILDYADAAGTATYGSTAYATINEAVTAAQGNDDAVITLAGALAGNAIVTGGQQVTFTGEATLNWKSGWFFVGRGGEQADRDAVTYVTFKDATIGNTEPDTYALGFNVSKYDSRAGKEQTNTGVLTFEDSVIATDYIYNVNVVNVINTTLTAGNLSISGKKAAESRSGEDEAAYLNLSQGSYVTVLIENGHNVGDEGGGVLNITGGSTFLMADANNNYGNRTWSVTDKGQVNLSDSSALIVADKLGGGLVNNGTITIDCTSDITAEAMNNAGTISIDVAGISTSAVKLIDTNNNFTSTGTIQFVKDGEVVTSDDYTYSITDGDLFVKAKSYVAEINGVKYETLSAAYAAAQSGDTVKLLVDEISSITGIPAGVTLEGVEGKTSVTSTLSQTLDDVTIRNIKFAASGSALRWCYLNADKTFIVDNCEFAQGGAYGLHFDGNNKGDVIVTNSVIKGWNSFAVSLQSVSISDSIIIPGSYAMIRPYVNTTFTNCQFTEAFAGFLDTHEGSGIELFGENTVMELSGCSIIKSKDDPTVSTEYSVKDLIVRQPYGDIGSTNKVGVKSNTSMIVVDPVKDGEGKYTNGTFFANVASVIDSYLAESGLATVAGSSRGLVYDLSAGEAPALEIVGTVSGTLTLDGSVALTVASGATYAEGTVINVSLPDGFSGDLMKVIDNDGVNATFGNATVNFEGAGYDKWISDDGDLYIKSAAVNPADRETDAEGNTTITGDAAEGETQITGDVKSSGDAEITNTGSGTLEVGSVTAKDGDVTLEAANGEMSVGGITAKNAAITNTGSGTLSVTGDTEVAELLEIRNETDNDLSHSGKLAAKDINIYNNEQDASKVGEITITQEIAAVGDISITNASTAAPGTNEGGTIDLGTQTHTAEGGLNIVNKENNVINGGGSEAGGDEQAANITVKKDVTITNAGHLNANIKTDKVIEITNTSVNTLIGSYEGAELNLDNTGGAAHDVTLTATAGNISVVNAQAAGVGGTIDTVTMTAENGYVAISGDGATTNAVIDTNMLYMGGTSVEITGGTVLTDGSTIFIAEDENLDPVAGAALTITGDHTVGAAIVAQTIDTTTGEDVLYGTVTMDGTQTYTGDIQADTFVVADNADVTIDNVTFGNTLFDFNTLAINGTLTTDFDAQGSFTGAGAVTGAGNLKISTDGEWIVNDSVYRDFDFSGFSGKVSMTEDNAEITMGLGDALTTLVATDSYFADGVEMTAAATQAINLKGADVTTGIVFKGAGTLNVYENQTLTADSEIALTQVAEGKTLTLEADNYTSDITLDKDADTAATTLKLNKDGLTVTGTITGDSDDIIDADASATLASDAALDNFSGTVDIEAAATTVTLTGANTTAAKFTGAGTIDADADADLTLTATNALNNFTGTVDVAAAATVALNAVNTTAATITGAGVLDVNATQTLTADAALDTFTGTVALEGNELVLSGENDTAATFTGTAAGKITAAADQTLSGDISGFTGTITADTTNTATVTISGTVGDTLNVAGNAIVLDDAVAHATPITVNADTTLATLTANDNNIALGTGTFSTVTSTSGNIDLAGYTVGTLDTVTSSTGAIKIDSAQNITVSTALDGNLAYTVTAAQTDDTADVAFTGGALTYADAMTVTAADNYFETPYKLLSAGTLTFDPAFSFTLTVGSDSGEIEIGNMTQIGGTFYQLSLVGDAGVEQTLVLTAFNGTSNTVYVNNTDPVWIAATPYAEVFDTFYADTTISVKRNIGYDAAASIDNAIGYIVADTTGTDAGKGWIELTENVTYSIGTALGTAANKVTEMTLRSRSDWGNAKLTGDINAGAATTLNLENLSATGSVYGAGTVNITGAKTNRFSGANIAAGGELNITGGTYTARYIAGGAYNADSDTDSSVTINGAADRTSISGTVYGGSIATGTGVAVTQSGKASVTINADNLVYLAGNIYAAGLARSGASLTVTGDREVTFTGLGANLSFTRRVSGAAQGGTVSGGTANLNFADFAGKFNGSISDFNTITISGGSAVEFGRRQTLTGNTALSFALNSASDSTTGTAMYSVRDKNAWEFAKSITITADISTASGTYVLADNYAAGFDGFTFTVAGQNYTLGEKTSDNYGATYIVNYAGEKLTLTYGNALDSAIIENESQQSAVDGSKVLVVYDTNVNGAALDNATNVQTISATAGTTVVFNDDTLATQLDQNAAGALLYKDSTTDEIVWVGNGDTATVSGNLSGDSMDISGKSLTVDNANISDLTVNDNAELTLNSGASAIDAITVAQGANLTLNVGDGATVTDTGSGAVTISGSNGTVTINNTGTLTAQVTDAGTVVISNTSFNSLYGAFGGENTESIALANTGKVEDAAFTAGQVTLNDAKNDNGKLGYYKNISVDAAKLTLNADLAGWTGSTDGNAIYSFANGAAVTALNITIDGDTSFGTAEALAVVTGADVTGTAFTLNGAALALGDTVTVGGTDYQFNSYNGDLYFFKGEMPVADMSTFVVDAALANLPTFSTVTYDYVEYVVGVNAFGSLDDAFNVYGDNAHRNTETERIVIKSDITSTATGKQFFYSDRDVVITADAAVNVDMDSHSRVYFMGYYDVTGYEGAPESVPTFTIGENVNLSVAQLMAGQAIDYPDDVDDDGNATRDAGAAHIVINGTVYARQNYATAYSTIDVADGGKLLAHPTLSGYGDIMRALGTINIIGDGTKAEVQYQPGYIQVQNGTLNVKDTWVSTGTVLLQDMSAKDAPFTPERTGDSTIVIDNSKFDSSVSMTLEYDAAKVILKNGSEFTISGGVTNNGTIEIADSTLTAGGTLTNSGVVNISGNSTVTAQSVSGNDANLLDGAALSDSTLAGVYVHGSAAIENSSLGTVKIGRNTADESGTLTVGENVTMTGMQIGYGASSPSPEGITQKVNFNHDTAVNGTIYAFRNSDVTVANGATLAIQNELYVYNKFTITEGATVTAGANYLMLAYGDTIDFTVENNSTLTVNTNWIQMGESFYGDSGAGTFTVKSGSSAALNGSSMSIKAAMGVVVDDATLTSTANITNNGSITLTDGTFTTTKNLTNNGTINASGTVTMNAKSFSGNAILVADGTIVKDSSISGAELSTGTNPTVLTFEGANTIGRFSMYANDKVVIGEGASVYWSGSRGGLGYGNSIDIDGTISAGTARDMSAEDKAALTASLSTTGLSLQTSSSFGASTLSVDNAYVVFGNESGKTHFTSKASANYGGSYDIDFTNSVVDINGNLSIQHNKRTNNPTYEFTFTGSQLNITGRIVNDVDNSTMTFDNTVVATADAFRNSGTFRIVNGSDVSAKAVNAWTDTEKGELNAGSIVVDKSTFTVTTGQQASHLHNIGGITLSNDAAMTIDYLVNTNGSNLTTGEAMSGSVVIDASSKLTVSQTLTNDSVINGNVAMTDADNTLTLDVDSVLNGAVAMGAGNDTVAVTGVTAKAQGATESAGSAILAGAVTGAEAYKVDNVAMTLGEAKQIADEVWAKLSSTDDSLVVSWGRSEEEVAAASNALDAQRNEMAIGQALVADATSLSDGAESSDFQKKKNNGSLA